jgi:hypothetical protein
LSEEIDDYRELVVGDVIGRREKDVVAAATVDRSSTGVDQ